MPVRGVVVNRAHSAFAERSFRHTSTTVWNSLSAKCRNCLGLTVEIFRKHVKTYLFETALGRLKMREWKNRHGRKCRGGTGGSGNIGTILQGWKMRKWKHRERSILQNVMLWSAEKRMVRLISRKIIFEEFQRVSSQSTNVTNRRTDRWTTYHGNTALCYASNGSSVAENCHFYRAMHFSANARSWDRMSSVCPSVCPSVRL